MKSPYKAVVLQNEKDYSQLHIYMYVLLQPPDRVIQSFLTTKSGKNGNNGWKGGENGANNIDLPNSVT